MLKLRAEAKDGQQSSSQWNVTGITDNVRGSQCHAAARVILLGIARVRNPPIVYFPLRFVDFLLVHGFSQIG